MAVIRLAPPEVRLDPEPRDDVAARLVHSHGFVIYRIGALRLGIEDSRALAVELTHRLRDALVDAGAPAELRVEQVRPQATHVPDGHPARTLLPHHDGQHCSYLTPSRLDDGCWRSGWREFGTTGDPDADTGTVAPWLGANLRAALERQPEHGCPYPGIGGMLGLGEPLWHGISLHHAEEPLPAEVRTRYPLAVPLAAACPYGGCAGESARLFCHQLLSATGRNWRLFRDRWEALAPSERYDLLVGHNLTMLHGGLAGAADRVIEPLCLVVDTPAGQRYEEWLAASWRRRLPAGSGRPRG